MFGKSEIPELSLEVLQKFVTTFTTPPELALSTLFPESDSPSSTIKWESHRGGRGLTPFVPPGAPAPVTEVLGIASHQAEAAFWKEKIPFDEEFLNNIKKEGTTAEYMGAAQRLARELQSLSYRNMRRKEWMFAKMLTAGTFSYNTTKGVMTSVDYDVATAHIVTKSAAEQWDDGADKDIIGDIIAGKKIISDDCGGKVTHAVMSSTVLKYLARDPSIQTLLQKSTFGNGDLYSGSKNSIVGVNPNVIGSLLDIPNIVVYDEKFECRAYHTAAVSTVTVTVDNVADFEVGGTLRFVDVSAGTYEDETIASISTTAGTITTSSAVTLVPKVGEDYVYMVRPFIPEDIFVMFAANVEGQPIAEFKRAPFALDRHYGIKMDQNEEWDPEVVWIRCQNKGLPVLYQRDAMYVLDVA